MSAQRAMPSTSASRATFRLIAALILGIVLGAAGAFLLTVRTTEPARRRVMARI